jgi:hypothetical protein
LSIVLKGNYYNVKPKIKNKPPNEIVKIPRTDGVECYVWNNDESNIPGEYNEKFCYVEGIFNSWKNFFHMKNSIWFSKAIDQHYLKIPKRGAWTLLLEGRPYHKWGFYVNEHKWRPLRYFHKFGILQTKDYQ